jgi:hypothetical protein
VQTVALRMQCQLLLFCRKAPATSRAVQRTITVRAHQFAAVAAAGISVASCAGTIKEGMAKYEGLPLSAAIAKIGPPLDERWIAGKKAYIWGSIPETSAKGAKGAKDDKQCQIRAIMNGDVIESLDYQGDEGLCQRYAARLRP